mgnify:FL=1
MSQTNAVAPVTIYYLAMNSPDALNEKQESQGLQVTECVVKQYALNRFLYEWVGGPWNWTDKLSWTNEQWQQYAEAENLRTWVAYSQGSPAGYYELQEAEGGHVELSYFGLASKFIGQGFGGYLLSHAIKTAWNLGGTKRVGVNTCSLDHPSALRNYQARGFELYRTTTQ